MADLLYLNLWLNDYGESNMLLHWRRVIETFPISPATPGIRSLTIYPFDWGETPVFERSFAEDTSAADAVAIADEFLHDDYAYEAQVYWELWAPSPKQEGWTISPSAVSISCLGLAFDSESSLDRPHLQINFGLDTPFLPQEEWRSPEPGSISELTALRSRENLQQLLEFVHRLDKNLPIAKRSLWCESGENLADKIMAAWSAPKPDFA